MKRFRKSKGIFPMWFWRELSGGVKVAVWRDGDFEWELSQKDMYFMEKWGLSYGKAERPTIAQAVRAKG